MTSPPPRIDGKALLEVFRRYLKDRNLPVTHQRVAVAEAVFFSDSHLSVGDLEAQECLPNNDTRDRFAEDISYAARLWEAISPDPMLGEYETDYRWLIHPVALAIGDRARDYRYPLVRPAVLRSQ